MGNEGNIMEFHEAVRKRPAMYIGSAGTSGGFALMKDIFKELLEASPESEIDFSVNKQDEICFSFSINQDRISELVCLFQKNIHYQNKFFSLYVAAALSNHFRLSIKSETKIYSCEYADGKLMLAENKMDFSSGETLKAEIKLSLTTLIVSFQQEDIWRFIQRLDQLACMYPNAKFFVEDERGERKTSLIIQRQDGLLDLFIGNFPYNENLKDSKFSQHIHFNGIKNNISYQILIDFRNYHLKGLKRMFFLNAELCGENCSHEQAVNESILEVANEARSKNQNLIGASFVRTMDSLNIYVSVFELESVSDLNYLGPTKHRFVSQSIHDDIKEVTKEQLKLTCAADKDFLWTLVNLEV